MRAAVGGSVLAHGLGDAGDLPVELPVVLFLAAMVVLGAAALAERSATPVEHPPARPLPRLTAVADARPTRVLLRGLALAGWAIVVVTAMLGPSPASTNPAPRTFFVLFLGLLVPASALLGPVWRIANPFRTLAAALARLSGDAGQEAVRPLPAGIGVWPAVVQLAVVVWAGRSAADTAGGVLVLVLALTAVQLLAALRYGPAWFTRGDPFEVLSEVVATIAPIGRGPDGLLGRRPLALAHRRLAAVPGVGVLLGLVIASHLSDFLIDTPLWHGWRATLTSTGQVVIDTATLAVTAAVVVAGVLAATRRTSSLLAAVVPVAVGYAVAHDLGELLVEGQFALIQLSDPLGRGWNLLGLQGRFVPAEPLPAGLVAVVVVVVLLAGHAAAVRVAHDGLRRRHDRRTAAALQLPLRVLLVVSAVAGVAARLIVG